MPSDKEMLTRADIARLVSLGFRAKGYGVKGQLKEAYLEKAGSDAIEIPLRMVTFALDCEKEQANDITPLLDLVSRGYVVRWWKDKGQERTAKLQSRDGMDAYDIPAHHYDRISEAARARAKADKIAHQVVANSSGIRSYGYREADATLEVTTYDKKTGKESTYRLIGPTPEEVAYWIERDKKTSWFWHVLSREYSAIPHDPIDPVSMDEIRAQFEASIEGLTNNRTPLYEVEGDAA